MLKRFLSIFILASSFTQYSSAQNSQRPNIVWIVCEDMSPHLSCFGESKISTPNLDALAKDGVRYNNVYTVAGVCSPSRCGIITGMYPSAIGGNNMRTYQPGRKEGANTVKGIPTSYSIVPPASVKCFPEYLRIEGYYCTNNAKEDYQFQAPVTAWDQSGKKAHWRNAPKNKPFFAVFNLTVTHESQLWERDSIPLEVDPSKVNLPPYYPDVPEARQAVARQLSNVIEMDRQAGRLIQELKDAGLYDKTIIFFYSDHGDALPFTKREISRRGLHVPLIIKFPSKLNAGKEDNRMISGIDFGATVLSLAGIRTPGYMHGRAFAGIYEAKEKRKYIFAARDRMDSAVDRVRSVYDGRYEYLRNYMPERPYYQNIAYRLQIPLMRKILALKDENKLDSVQLLWFRSSKQVEELYDTEKDPYQFKNLAADPAYAEKLGELKTEFDKWITRVGDRHSLPEQEMLKQMWNGKSAAPQTEKPQIKVDQSNISVICKTDDASIGYKILKKETKPNSIPWQVYTPKSKIVLSSGEKLLVRAQRIGYLPSDAELVLP